MALFTMEFCAYILPRPIEIRALLGAVSTDNFVLSSAMKLGPVNKCLVPPLILLANPKRKAAVTYMQNGLKCEKLQLLLNFM